MVEQYVGVEFRDPNVPVTEEQMLNRKQIFHQITTEPETFNMDLWDSEAFRDQYDDCGTTKCIAGWALHFAEIKIDDLMVIGNVLMTDMQITREAIKVMGLSKEEYYPCSQGLFHLYSDEDAIEAMRKLTE